MSLLPDKLFDQNSAKSLLGTHCSLSGGRVLIIDYWECYHHNQQDEDEDEIYDDVK